MVRIDPPPPHRPPYPLYHIIYAGTHIFRIFDPSKYNATALSFRSFGPKHRFDHQRGTLSHPVDDPDRRIYYAGSTFSCSLVECYGDGGFIDINQEHIAKPVVKRELKLLDLRGAGAMRAGSVAALAKIADRSLSQEWARYFYETSSIYGLIDGISYLNAHNDEEAMALFERAEDALDCTAANVIRMNHSGLRSNIQKIAIENNLYFA